MVPPLRGGIAWENDPWVRSFLAHTTAMVVWSLRDRRSQLSLYFLKLV
jgi:hypothetical protein